VTKGGVKIYYENKGHVKFCSVTKGGVKIYYENKGDMKFSF